MRAKRQTMDPSLRASGMPTRGARLHWNSRAAVTPGSIFCRCRAASRREAFCGPALSTAWDRRPARALSSSSQSATPERRARPQVGRVVGETQRARRERRGPLGLGGLVVVGEVGRAGCLHPAERRRSIESDREVALEEAAQDRVDQGDELVGTGGRRGAGDDRVSRSELHPPALVQQRGGRAHRRGSSAAAGTAATALRAASARASATTALRCRRCRAHR